MNLSPEERDILIEFGNQVVAVENEPIVLALVNEVITLRKLNAKLIQEGLDKNE